MAIAVGNTHLQTSQGSEIDERALGAIALATRRQVPLVIHGGSGVASDQRLRLARTTPVCKFNIGTELRQTFGAALRQTLSEHPDEFDRIRILAATEEPMTTAARRVMREMKGRSGW
jgi:fructose-bisphosphate aldolase class II